MRAISIIAASVIYPFSRWARYSNGIKADRLTGYRLTMSSISCWYCSLSMSSITFAHHDVVGPEDRDDVGYQIASRHMVERSHVHERRSADLQAIGPCAAVAHDEKSQLTLRSLGRTVRFRFRRLEP